MFKNLKKKWRYLKVAKITADYYNGKTDPEIEKSAVDFISWLFTGSEFQFNKGIKDSYIISYIFFIKEGLPVESTQEIIYDEFLGKIEDM